jgi:hypothetical protein
MQEVTTDLGVHYRAWKDNEKAKDKDKARFWSLITAEASTSFPLDEALFEVVGAGLTEQQARERAEKYNPRFAVDMIREVEDGWEAIMVERPEFVPYTFVNVEDGMVYQRQVVPGGQLLDDDRMREEDPDLYEEVTFELPWGDRIVRPLDALDPRTLADVQGYIYRGKPSVKLPAPRKATEEELGSVAA